MKEVVLKLDYDDDKIKQEAMKIVFGPKGIDSIAMDMKDKKLTMIGHMDTVAVVTKLSNVCHTEIVTVGPAKEPNKKEEEPKKEEPKKKVVLKLDFHDDKGKQEAMKKVSGLLKGIDSIAMDMKSKKLTMIGHIDTVAVVTKLSTVCHTEIVTVGRAKEPDKKEEPKIEEPNKKAVFKVDFHDDEGKQEAMKKVSGLLNGVDSIAMDIKDKKLTMIGDMDPLAVGAKLRDKLRTVCHIELLMVWPTKEPDKKKEEPKKEEPKKNGGDDKKKDVRRKKDVRST